MLTAVRRSQATSREPHPANAPVSSLRSLGPPPRPAWTGRRRVVSGRPWPDPSANPALASVGQSGPIEASVPLVFHRVDDRPRSDTMGGWCCRRTTAAPASRAGRTQGRGSVSTRVVKRPAAPLAVSGDQMGGGAEPRAEAVVDRERQARTSSSATAVAQLGRDHAERPSPRADGLSAISGSGPASW